MRGASCLLTKRIIWVFLNSSRDLGDEFFDGFSDGAYIRFPTTLHEFRARPPSIGHWARGFFPIGDVERQPRPAHGLHPPKVTGQRSYMDDPTTTGATEGFGLMFYNARWYDPQLGRFAQADTIIPEQSQGTQAWDRYAYTNNNPLRYTDPSGHQVPCDFCDLWDKTRTAFMQFVGRTYLYKNNQADDLGELMTLALFREPEAEIIGGALDDIATDHVLDELQAEVVESITGNSQYGQVEFELEQEWSITFGEMGNNNMFEDAAQGQTWTVRAATVESTFSVSQSGDITADYLLTDTLDLEPDWYSGARTGMSGLFYNITTQVLGKVWHDVLGASYMRTTARWQTNISKEK